MLNPDQKTFDTKTACEIGKDFKPVDLEEATRDYIRTYLTPYEKWNIEISGKKRIDSVRYAHVDWDVISNHIKKMEYRDFLVTPYWKTIAAHTKYRARYRCQVCNYGYNLVTHHRNYDIHGQEHAHIHELIVLCKYCHEKFHDADDSNAKISPCKKTKPDSSRPFVLDLIVIFGFALYALVITHTISWGEFLHLIRWSW